jgi:beta-phosphoglucomutase-like phosphatase (HAD superfamily)
MSDRRPEAPAPGRRFAVRAVAFDLDGTLLDTVHDLSTAVNCLLAEHGWRPLPKEAVRNLVGKGMANLVSRAVDSPRCWSATRRSTRSVSGARRRSFPASSRGSSGCTPRASSSRS